MEEKKDRSTTTDKDLHLGIPSEANQDKHINFLDLESGDEASGDTHKKDTATEERRQQWQEGLEAGKKANREGDA